MPTLARSPSSTPRTRAAGICRCKPVSKPGYRSGRDSKKDARGVLFSCGRRSGGSALQRFFQQLVQRGELRLADVALDDLAVAADDEGGRRQCDLAVGLGGVAAGVDGDLERQLARGRVVDHVV